MFEEKEFDLREKVIEKASSMLVDYLCSRRLDKNGNALTFDNRKTRKETYRTNKCRSWLLKTNETFPRKTLIETKVDERNFSNSSSFVEDSEKKNFPQAHPMIIIHKKRFKREKFMSKIENFNPNCFYAFDRTNLLKIQRKSDDEQQKIIENKQNENEENFQSNSELVLARLEEILNLCTELRSLTKDFQSNSIGEKSQPNVINIDAELDDRNLHERTIDDLSSIRSQSQGTNSLPRTESFKTTFKKAEDICQCFLKSLESQKPMSAEDEQYLQELTKAYLLGREQMVAESNNNQTDIDISKEESFRTKTKNQKYYTFLHQPIGSKSTQVIPGIGQKYSEQLADYGFQGVRRLIGFYLMIKNDQQFINWLTTKVKISFSSAKICTETLRVWCQKYL